MDNLSSSQSLEHDLIATETSGYNNSELFYDRVSSSRQLSLRILKHIFKYRRSTLSSAKCNEPCLLDRNPHFKKILSAVHNQKPITFILPAFPGKSPNVNKVLGPLPDMAEELALKFLNQLCEQIKTMYPSGAHIILCSDGRVFSDVVGMREGDVTNYQTELSRKICELNLKNLSTFNLDDLSLNNNFNVLREKLLKNFGKSISSIKDRILEGSKPNAISEDQDLYKLYLGITRFLVEDSIYPGQTKSRSSIQKESKMKSLEVIQRSNAWSELISNRFPEAVRLSIHPQSCGSQKLGIRLIANESWMTPWHGVALKTDNGFKLVKRKEAEGLGAELVLSADGRPSHYELKKVSTCHLVEETIEAL